MSKVLSIENLHVAIDGKEILKGVDLTIRQGEIHALMGPNGSGKSTLSYALMGHPNYEVTEGSVTLDGVDLLDLEADERAKAGLFLAFQYPTSIPGVTVANFLRHAVTNVRNPERKEGEDLIPMREFRKELRATMDELGMDPEFARRYLNEGFSGGEKKRAEILQLAMLRPTFAILDETDSGLDIDAVRLVSEGVNQVAARTGTGVLVITHYQRILNYIKPQFVHILFGGRIVESGGPELVDVLEREGYDWIRAKYPDAASDEDELEADRSAIRPDDLLSPTTRREAKRGPPPMATDLNLQVEGIKDEYKYGFHDSDRQLLVQERQGPDPRDRRADLGDEGRARSGCATSASRRSTSSGQKPTPTWGGDLSELNFDDIHYYMKAADRQGKTWDDVPAEIKNTFDKLGIPEAERKFLAGVGAQYESEVVYHSLREDLQKKGVIFCDTDTAVREHPRPGPRVLRHDHPDPRQQVRRAELGGLVRAGRSSTSRPGVKVDIPLQAYFRINAENMGQFERTLIIVEEGAQVHYVEGCTAPIYTTREPALGGRRDHRQEGRAVPLHDDPELGQQHLQPRDQAGRRLRGRRDGVGRRQPRQPADDEVPGRPHDGQGGPRRDPLDRLRRQGPAPGRRRQGRPRGPLHQLADHLQEHQQERRPGQLPRPAQGRRRRQGLEVERRLRRPDPRRPEPLGHLSVHRDRRGRRQDRPRGERLEDRRGAALLPDEPRPLRGRGLAP